MDVQATKLELIKHLLLVDKESVLEELKKYFCQTQTKKKL